MADSDRTNTLPDEDPGVDLPDSVSRRKSDALTAGGCVRRLAAGLGITCAAIVALGLLPPFAFGTWRIVDGGHYLPTAAAGALFWLLAAALATVLLRRRSSSYRSLGCLLVVLLPICVMTGMGTLRAINCELDGSAPVVRRAEILEKTSHRARTIAYYFRIRSWRSGESTRLLEVEDQDYFAAERGEHLVVTTRRGRLGWEWVERVALEPPPPAGHPGTQSREVVSGP